MERHEKVDAMTAGGVLLSGWGRQRWIETQVLESEDLERASTEALLSRGLGRAYGDAALPPPSVERPVLRTVRANRILAFDHDSGLIKVEAGVTLSELTRLFLPRLWFSPVVPGTRHVTVGGMVASDVHGKNHHVAGSFGRYVRALKLRTGDRVVRECSRTVEPELFWATIGGMGLTGHILEVEFALERLPTTWIYEESERFSTLTEVFEALRAARANWPMTVAWIDTSATGRQLGRGIVMRGRWATADEAPDPRSALLRERVRMPFDAPNGLINPYSIGVANAVWFHKHGRRARQHFVTPEQFFWPLDVVKDWNRAFGNRGFTQYQCVLPWNAEVVRGFVALFQKWRACSFVTVLKDSGEEGEGLLTFLKPGVTIAVDIPIRRVDEARAMVRAFNSYVLDHDGRIYLAKDSFTERDQFERMYPRLPAWRRLRDTFDPERRIDSALSQRLLDDGGSP